MPDIHNDNYSIVLHTREPRVLLFLEKDGWTLPRHQATDADEINAAMEEQLHVKTTVLYCAYHHFRDAYLAPWTCYEPIERLREAFSLAVRLGKLCRALTWQRFIAQLEPSAKWQYEGAFPYFLRVFLGTEE